jgi:mono/diheme cytochrome c family protein
MAGLSTKTAFRAGAVLPLLALGLLSLTGCTDSYPADLDYPLRSDPIVTKVPETPITALDPPGTLEQWIDAIPDKGGQVVDPTAGIEKQQLAKVNAALSKGTFDITDEEARDMGLVSKPGKDTAKATLEDRKGALEKRIKAIDAAMAKYRKPLDKALRDLFGTPAAPKIDLGEDEGKQVGDVALDDKALADGSKLYRRHCLHCHGLSGDGRGPTGPWVNPHPRDYRLGKFKFTSSAESQGARKARPEDLLRTLRQGVEGTSMPSFGLLDEEKELKPLIGYVIHLSLRGEVERDVLLATLGKDAEGDTDVAEMARERLELRWKQWKNTDKKPIKVGDVPSYAGVPAGQLSPAEKKGLDESIKRGFDLFTTGSAQCRSCHNDFGRANDYKYDEWGTIVRPANLTTGIYRGGRRPLDLFYRIHSGVNGSQMPAFNGSPLTSEQIWDIVNFLEAMPYKNMLPPEVKEQVYGKAE